MFWSATESFAVETVAGVKLADGRINPLMLETVRAGYKKSLFFCPALAALSHAAKTIRDAIKSHALLPDKEAPGLTSLNQAIEGQDACSLKSIQTIHRGLMTICDNPTQSEVIGNIGDALRQAFPHENILGENSIIPAFRTPDRSTLQRWREVASRGGDRSAFSAHLMKGCLGNPNAEREFLARLEEGCDTQHDGGGLFRLTDAAASLLHSRFRVATEDHPEFPDLDEFAPISVQDGPRKGQTSRALPASWGNRIP